MEEKELTTLLRSNDLEQRRRMWRCPDENQLAAYVSGQAVHRKKLEEHLADCKPCLETTAFLVQQFEGNESVPPGILARARSLGENAPTVKWNWGWTVAAATACLLIFASIVLWKSWSAQTVRPPTELVARNESTLPGKGLPVNANSPESVSSPHVEKPKVRETQTPVVRGEAGRTKLTLVFPREGSIVRLPLQSLRWVTVPDATFYEVRVVTLDGAAVATQSTNNTELLLPPDALKPGSKYYVTVVAHLSGNRSIRSDLVKFRVAESQ